MGLMQEINDQSKTHIRDICNIKIVGTNSFLPSSQGRLLTSFIRFSAAFPFKSHSILYIPAADVKGVRGNMVPQLRLVLGLLTGTIEPARSKNIALCIEKSAEEMEKLFAW